MWNPDSLRVELFGDNKSAIFTSNNPRTTQQSKHLDVRYFKTREDIEAGILSFTYVDTSDSIADFFAKSLACPAFSRFRRFLMNLPSGFQQHYCAIRKSALLSPLSGRRVTSSAGCASTRLGRSDS